MDRILQQRYRIVRLLGRGGRGVVYLCDDLRLPGHQWAIKQMQRPQPDQQHHFRAVFAKEVETLSRLRHPNLPLVVDSFEDGADSYLVMEFVDGEDLSDYVRRCGPLPEYEAFRLGLTLCGVLEYLHMNDPPIIFRDLKPENVMRGTDGAVKLIDFGLARRFVPGQRSDTVQAGSVGYAAPEQWENLSQTDARADIYSWGATMVFLMSGRIPSPQVPLAALRSLASSLSAEGCAVVSRCLATHPADRYATAVTLGDDAERVLRALESRPGGPVEPPHSTVGPGENRLPATGVKTVDVAVAPVADASSRAPSTGASGAASADPGARFAMRTPWSSLTVPMALLMLATLMFVTVVGSRIPRADPGSDAARASVVAPPLDAVGVGPYRSHGAITDKMLRARRLYAQRRWAEAIALLDEAVTQLPEDGYAHILKENAYLRLSGAPCVVVPLIVSTSGPDEADCTSDLQGAAMAQASINRQGGIRGKRVVVDCYDDGSSTSRCLDIAQRLVADPTVLVALGPSNSQRTLALAPLFNAAHVNLIAATASSTQIWQAGAYIFTASESRAPRIRSLARYALRAGRRRVACVVDGKSRLSFEMVQIFEAALRSQGGTVTVLRTFSGDQQDFHEQVDAVAQLHPDMIFFADYHGATLGRFASQLRQRGLSTPICAQTTPMSRELVDVGGRSVDGVLLSESYHPNLEAPQTRAFVRAFHEMFGDVTPTYVAAENFDALNAIAAGLRAAPTRVSLNAFFRACGVTRPAFDGVSGRFALGRCLDARPVWLIEVRNGRFRLLGPSPSESATKGSAGE